MKVLVTGGAGYVGCGLIRNLLSLGHEVTCMDSLLFGGESLLGFWHHPGFSFRKIDISNTVAVQEDLRNSGYEVVVHLAAIVGDPACKMYPDAARQTNLGASIALIDACRSNGVNRFIFASTCSNYGKMESSEDFVTEESILNPVSLYAELKVSVEKYLLKEIPKDQFFCPTVLRFSTVYGLSPRMRFDLTVNEFSKELALGRRLEVFGEQFWRPYCHVRDFATAFLAAMNAPEARVAYSVFNVGDSSENYRKRDIVEKLLEVMPSAKIAYVKKDEDPRDYRVDFTKIHKELGFKITSRVADGIGETIQVIKDHVITDPDNQKYYNIPHERPAY
jgi:nucleoside-diphosphate-sugar epimerase